MHYIQGNFLGQTAALGCEDIPTYREGTSSQSSGCSDGLVAPNHQHTSNKPPAHPEDGDEVRSRYVGKPSGCLPEKTLLNFFAAKPFKAYNVWFCYC
jgi:hypothetical protein